MAHTLNPNGDCVTCVSCCVEVCHQELKPRCDCCCCSECYNIAPNQEFQNGTLLATNEDGLLVPYDPNGYNNFVAVARYDAKSNDKGELVNHGTSHPFGGNPCPPKCLYVWLCGTFRINEIQPLGDISALDLVRSILASGHYGRFMPNGERPDGEFKLFG